MRDSSQSRSHRCDETHETVRQITLAGATFRAAQRPSQPQADPDTAGARMQRAVLVGAAGVGFQPQQAEDARIRAELLRG